MTWPSSFLKKCTLPAVVALCFASCSDGGSGSTAPTANGSTDAGDLASIADTYHEVSGTLTHAPDASDTILADGQPVQNTFTLYIASKTDASTCIGWYHEKEGETTRVNNAAFGYKTDSTWRFVIADRYAGNYGAASYLLTFTVPDAEIFADADTAVTLSDAFVKGGYGGDDALTFASATVTTKSAWADQSFGSLALIQTDTDSESTSFTEGLNGDWELIQLTSGPKGPVYTTKAKWTLADSKQWEQSISTDRGGNQSASTVQGYFYGDADGKRGFVGMRTIDGEVSLAAFAVRSDSGGRRRLGGYFVAADGTLSSTYYLTAGFEGTLPALITANN